MADPVLSPLTTPIDLSLPANTQQLVNMVAAYLQITGLAGLQGVIISDTEPAATDRDKVWLKLDITSGRAIGFYRYLGGWNLVPVVVGTGASEPASPKPGELYNNTNGDALKAFLAGGWTTELWQKGATSTRPTSAPIGYLFYDTDIQRILRNTANGWSTLDGAIGELKMLTGITVDAAEKANPGWITDLGMAGRFAIGQDGDVADYPVGKEAGTKEIIWSANTASAAGGSREQGLLAGITLGTDSIAGAANTNKTGSGTIPILPPYRAVIFMRKAY